MRANFAKPNQDRRHGIHCRAFPLLLIAAAPSASSAIRPGAWEIVNYPGQASLDGKPLADLPYTAPPPERLCVTAADAADPARWLARDVPGDCMIARSRLRGGRVDVHGSCPAPDDGQPRGSFRLSGRFSATGYDLRFATTAHGDNGKMGFSGRLTGKRVGACP